MLPALPALKVNEDLEAVVGPGSGGAHVSSRHRGCGGERQRKHEREERRPDDQRVEVSEPVVEDVSRRRCRMLPEVEKESSAEDQRCEGRVSGACDTHHQQCERDAQEGMLIKCSGTTSRLIRLSPAATHAEILRFPPSPPISWTRGSDAAE